MLNHTLGIIRCCCFNTDYHSKLANCNGGMPGSDPLRNPETKPPPLAHFINRRIRRNTPQNRLLCKLEFLPKYNSVGMKPQWKEVFTTSKTTPILSLTPGDSILLGKLRNVLLLQATLEQQAIVKTRCGGMWQLQDCKIEGWITRIVLTACSVIRPIKFQRNHLMCRKCCMFNLILFLLIKL